MFHHCGFGGQANQAKIDIHDSLTHMEDTHGRCARRTDNFHVQTAEIYLECRRDGDALLSPVISIQSPVLRWQISGLLVQPHRSPDNALLLSGTGEAQSITVGPRCPLVVVIQPYRNHQLHLCMITQFMAVAWWLWLRWGLRALPPWMYYWTP
jgi:hypothetical protein